MTTSLNDLELMNRKLNLLDLNAEPAHYYATTMKYAESGKMKVYLEEFINILENEPNTKLIIMLNYTASIDYLAKKLKKWNPIIISGDSKYKKSKHEQTALINSFQQPNLKYKLLIGNLQMLASAVDLDDKDGRFPRKHYERRLVR
jgi:ERCC4-related helicase